METTNEKMEGRPSFEQELTALLNRHSKENFSNTPDFILAEYLTGCLEAFNKTAQARDKWYGINTIYWGTRNFEIIPDELVGKL